jgi:hypothetical protein
VDVDCAPPHENQDDTSRDAQGVSGGDMDGVSAPPPAFQAAACSAKPTSDAEAEGLCADGTCHALDLTFDCGDSIRSSPHGSLLEADLRGRSWRRPSTADLRGLSWRRPSTASVRLRRSLAVGWRRSWRWPPVVAPATRIGLPSSGRPRDRPPAISIQLYQFF